MQSSPGGLEEREMINSVHLRLREATRADHARLEARLDLPARLASAGQRRAVVEAFYDLHSGLEAAISPWLADVAGLDFQARRRGPRLEADLRALGCRPRPAGPAPQVNGQAYAFGLLYVLEGSTLGGRIVRKAVQAGGGDLSGLSFLDPYGDRLGERWRSFLAVLGHHVSSGAEGEAAAAGAVEGFRHAERRLCGALADV
jgi:heme oxygenase (biliverdin-IX-beta and delta-forming)